MKFDITEGTYVNKKDKAFVDYLVKCGRRDYKLQEPAVKLTPREVSLKDLLLDIEICFHF